MWIDREFLDSINEHLEDIIEGNFSLDDKKFEKFNSSKYNETIKLFSKLNNKLTNLIEDSNMMNQSAKDGKLDIKIDTTKYNGSFSKITNGINSTVDFTVGALKDVGDKLDKLSNGDFNAKIENDYQGDFNILKKSTNDLANYLNNLIIDSNMMNQSVKDGKLSVRIDTKKYKGDFVKITNGINETMDSSESIAWIKEGINILSRQLNANLSINDVCIKSLDTICNYINAGVGALYIYNENDEILELYSSYCFVEREDISNIYKIGDGVVGQVARQKTPILLKNIKRDSILINTATTSTPPINTYTYPVIYQDKLYGVIEIGVSVEFSKKELDFFNEANDLLATSIYAGFQNKIVNDLYLESKETNQLLQNQSERLQVQSEELQQANAELEEQQQRLEEANAQMEEQQQMLENAKIELEKQNKSLEFNQQKLLEKTKELEMSNKYKSEFLANMSHELRTPLNSIILLSNLLSKNKNKNLTDEEIQKANIIYQSGNELLKLIGDILDLTKVEAGKMDLSIEKLNLNQILEEGQNLFSYIAKDKNLKFECKNSYSLDIYSDKAKISQIIKNLLSNSFKFTKDGEVKLIFEEGKNKELLIKVIDTGIGIPKDKIDKIFEAFSQVDGSTNREYGGTGLGLSISKEFAKLINATLSVNSTFGEGSEFILSIPNLEGQKDIKRNVSKDDIESLGIREHSYLIVEEDEEVAKEIRKKLNKYDKKCIIVDDISKAISIIKHYSIIGIFLDIELSNMSGMELLRELKSDSVYKKIPIFLISSTNSDIKFLQMGALGYLKKPLIDTELERTIEAIIKFQEKKVKRLLIVENDIPTQKAMIELIGNGTIKSTGVATKYEAINELKSGEYDLMVLDLVIEGGDGIEICEYVKGNNIKIPIIIYTAKELSKDENERLQQYTDSIIIKKANSNERLLADVDLFLHRVRITSDNKSETVSTVSLKDTKILVVDDDIKNIYVLESVLSEYKASTMHAKNGKEALEILDKNSDIDIVLMDIMMPVMDGYETMQKIRTNENTKNIPIIALTAKAMKDDRQKCISAGANDYISKPINSDKLIGMIKIWINQ